MQVQLSQFVVKTNAQSKICYYFAYISERPPKGPSVKDISDPRTPRELTTPDTATLQGIHRLVHRLVNIKDNQIKVK